MTNGATKTDSRIDDPAGSEHGQEKRPAREPEGPAHRSKGGSFQTVKRSVTEFKEDNGTDWAAALTYYSVLSIFPALVAMSRDAVGAWP